MITRADYMAKRATHAEYYAQFVTPQVRSFVARTIGANNIKTSHDDHFNDIPLSQWDALHGMLHTMCSRAVCACGTGGYSLSHTVCIAKEAARQIRAESQPASGALL